MVSDFDITGQQALAKARVLIIGVGGLGCPAAFYLAAAGVGRLYVMDNDTVALSNLQRQILFRQDDINQPKVDAAKQQLQAINPHITITALTQRFTAASLATLAGAIDLVLDCSDNSTTRLSINQACLNHQLPLISGAATGWQGQLTSFDFRNGTGPCYQCLFNGPIDDDNGCNNNGIISPIAGIVGVSQALEAIKLISSCGHINHGRLRCFDGLTGDWRTFSYQQDPSCTICKYSN